MSVMRIPQRYCRKAPVRTIPAKRPRNGLRTWNLSGAGRLVDQRLERLGLPHRQIGQNFPVDRDARALKQADKSAVGQAMLADRGVDPLDPQGAEIPLPQLAPDIGVLHRAVDRGIGRSDVVLAAAVKTLGLLEEALRGFWWN